MLSSRWCDTAVFFEPLLKQRGVSLGSFRRHEHKNSFFSSSDFSEAHYLHNKHFLGIKVTIPQLTNTE